MPNHAEIVVKNGLVGSSDAAAQMQLTGAAAKTANKAVKTNLPAAVKTAPVPGDGGSPSIIGEKSKASGVIGEKGK